MPFQSEIECIEIFCPGFSFSISCYQIQNGKVSILNMYNVCNKSTICIRYSRMKYLRVISLDKFQLRNKATQKIWSFWRCIQRKEIKTKSIFFQFWQYEELNKKTKIILTVNFGKTRKGAESSYIIKNGINLVQLLNFVSRRPQFR